MPAANHTWPKYTIPREANPPTPEKKPKNPEKARAFLRGESKRFGRCGGQESPAPRTFVLGDETPHFRHRTF
jgi:hypothetical protein